MSQNKIEFLLQIIDEDPEKPFPHFALAKEYQKVNDRINAKKQYQHLIDHSSEYGGTYYHFALLLIELHQDEHAQEIIRKGLSVLQNSGEIKLRNELLALRDQHFDL